MHITKSLEVIKALKYMIFRACKNGKIRRDITCMYLRCFFAYKIHTTEFVNMEISASPGQREHYFPLFGIFQMFDRRKPHCTCICRLNLYALTYISYMINRSLVMGCELEIKPYYLPTAAL